jgi:hypothetical protein
MNVWAKPYRRKDGTLMFYINNDRNVSLGIADRLYSTKMSKGQKKLLDAWRGILLQKLDGEDSAIFTGDIKAHKEAISPNHFGWVAATDVANVGGHSTSEDGVFLIHADTNKIINVAVIRGEVED